jgi:hypothetical protein
MKMNMATAIGGGVTSKLVNMPRAAMNANRVIQAKRRFGRAA